MLQKIKLKEQTKIIEGKFDDKLSTQKEICTKLLDERTDEIQKISKEIDYNKLVYYFKTPRDTPINCIKFKGTFTIFKETRDGDKTLQEIEEDQKKFN